MRYSNATTLHQILREIRINATYSSFLRTWIRRTATFTGYVLAWLLAMALLPLLLAAFLAGDIMFSARARWSRTRCLLFALLYLNCEVIGLAATFVAWVASGRFLGMGKTLFIRMNLQLQALWAYALFTGSKKVFSLTFEVDGEECLTQGPFILFIRHLSMADTILPSIFITRRFGVVLRYVLKKELLWDPCLDVVGNRLPNVFIDRSGSQTAIELNAIRRLARDLGSQDGILLYPEGTRFSPAKRERALRRLLEAGHEDLHRTASLMKHVLPPRPGGPMAVLESARQADAVFCAHTGFEGATRFKDLQDGVLVGKTIRISFWRIRAENIPRDQRCVPWLYDQWLRVDRWIDRHSDK
jgi:1-acyl-sn-glycerol-3-phosphate acyltransferase